VHAPELPFGVRAAPLRPGPRSKPGNTDDVTCPVRRTERQRRQAVQGRTERAIWRVKSAQREAVSITPDVPICARRGGSSMSVRRARSVRQIECRSSADMGARRSEVGSSRVVDLQQFRRRAVHLDEGNYHAGARAVRFDDHPMTLKRPGARPRPRMQRAARS